MKILFVLMMLFFTMQIFGQMPPHPDLVEKIKTGVIDIPSPLKNIEILRARGIDAPWSDDNLKKNMVETNFNGRKFGPAMVPSGNWKALALLVEFSDHPSITQASYFDSMLFEQTSGTMWDYFKDVSYGQLDIVSVNLPASIGWSTAPSTYEYYTNGDYGMGDYPRNARKLVEDVVQMVDGIVDFSQYDNDNDGDVDALMIIHSGPGAEYTGEVDDIWSHMWSTRNAPKLDGVWITRYSIQPEYFTQSGDMTIGVYCHELGHSAFGLPDLYDTDYSSNGLGRWSLMSGGSWNGNSGDTPAFPDAYCHIQMGYVDPVVISTNVIGQTIAQVETNAEIYKIYPNNVPGDEYFLVENRQLVGYDSDLRQGGLHIYHVDENVNSSNKKEWYPGNTSSGHYLVALEQADGVWDLEKDNNSNDRGDVYPGNTDNRTFNYNSTPNSRTYNDDDSEIAIINISNSQAVMTVDIELFEMLELDSPNGGENWVAGTEYDIMWSSAVIDNIDIEYSTNNGSSWITIVSSYPASGGSYAWTVPGTPSNECLLKISDAQDNDPSDQSDAVFTISQEGVYYNISGNVLYNRSGIPLDNADVELYQGASLIKSTVSDVDGTYLLSEVVPGSYTIRTSKTEGWGGSMASDALEVALYEVHPDSTFLPDEMALSAGWVTLLGASPSAADALSILNRSVGNTSQYNIPDWQFKEMIISVSSSDVQADITGICAGDARSDFDPSGAATKSNVSVITDEVLNISPGSTFDIPLKITEASEVGSFFFSLRYPSDKIELVNIERAGGTLVHNCNGDILSVAWADLSGKNPTLVDAGRELVTLSFIAYESFLPSEQVTIEVLKGREITDRAGNNLRRMLSLPIIKVTLPESYTLSQNYPNPFNPSTTIKYELPSGSRVSMYVYNLLGEEIAQLVNDTQDAGSYEVVWDASGLVSGVYLLKLSAGNFVDTKKMLLMK